MKTTKMSLASFALLCSFALAAPLAHAGLWLEPNAGYSFGSWSRDTTTESDKGLTYGARIGYAAPMGFLVGVDLMSGNWNDGANPSNNITPQDLGIYIGYKFPILVRIWGAYDFNSQEKFSSGSSTDTFKGTALKLGIGFSVLPLLSINFDYRMATYSQDDSGSISHDLHDNMATFGVSIPLDL